MKNYLICKYTLIAKTIHNLTMENESKLLFSASFYHKKRNDLKKFFVRETECKMEVVEKLPIILFLKNPKIILQHQEKINLILFFHLLKQFMPFTKNIPYQKLKLIKNIDKKQEFRGFQQSIGLHFFFTSENNQKFFKDLILLLHHKPTCFIQHTINICRKNF